MPSPRAVLADIHDFNLDPKKAHSATDKVGRLRSPGHFEASVTEDVSTQEVEVVAEKTTPEVHAPENAVVTDINIEEKEKKDGLLAEDTAIQELEKEVTQDSDTKKNKKKVKQQKSDS